MIVTSVLIPKFGPEESKTLIEGLGRLSAELQARQPPGFVQTMLLRETKGHAQLLTFWERRGDLDAFMASELGARLAKLFGEIAGKVEFRDYFVTWQTDPPEPVRAERRTNCC